MFCETPLFSDWVARIRGLSSGAVQYVLGFCEVSPLGKFLHCLQNLLRSTLRSTGAITGHPRCAEAFQSTSLEARDR